MFTPFDRLALKAAGIDSQSVIGAGRCHSLSLHTRLLEAATGGRLIGDDLHSTAPELVVRLDDQELTPAEYEALADLLRSDHLVWIGQRIAATATGRELLNDWERSQRRSTPCSHATPLTGRYDDE